MQAQVVVVGAARIDEVRDRRGLVEKPAGAGIDTARLLARAGVGTALLARIGDDEDGRRIRATLADGRIALAEIVASEERTSRRRVVDDGRGESIVHDVAGHGAAVAVPSRVLEGARVVVRADAEARALSLPVGDRVVIDLGADGEALLRGIGATARDRVLVAAVLAALATSPLDGEARLRRSIGRIET